jgi:hypothetical protein
MLFDRWTSLKTALPPSMAELVVYLNEPLEEADKVPLSNHDMMMLVSRGEPWYACSQHDLEQLFRPSEDEESDYIRIILMTAIINSAPDKAGSKASFISFWDDNIRKIISGIISPSTAIRDSNRNSGTLLQRPDFGFLMGGDCVFRGEEKAPVFSGPHPRDELAQKLTWI